MEQEDPPVKGELVGDEGMRGCKRRAEELGLEARAELGTSG